MNDDTRTMLIDMKRQLTPHDLEEQELKAAFTKSVGEVKTFKCRLARLKGMQTQWAPFKNQIDKYTARKARESNQLPEKINRLRTVIKNNCAHPIEYLVVSTQYVVLDNPVDQDPHTEYYIECTLCKKSEKVKTISHKSYN